MTATISTLDTHQSVYREKLLEHLLVGELLKYSWLHHGATLEVSQPAIDRAGHDIVLEANGVTRHVQLKASSRASKTAVQTVHVGLEAKPSGCVIWIRFDPKTLELGPFHFFGGAAGAPLPSLSTMKVARHTKGNSAGKKNERPNIRELRRSRFSTIETIPDLYAALFATSTVMAEQV